MNLQKKVASPQFRDEDSFWWGSSLRQATGVNDVEIRSFGQFVARYSPTKDEITWLDGKRPSELAQQSFNTSVEKLLSKEERP